MKRYYYFTLGNVTMGSIINYHLPKLFSSSYELAKFLVPMATRDKSGKRKAKIKLVCIEVLDGSLIETQTNKTSLRAGSGSKIIEIIPYPIDIERLVKLKTLKKPLNVVV